MTWIRITPTNAINLDLVTHVFWEPRTRTINFRHTNSCVTSFNSNEDTYNKLVEELSSDAITFSIN